MRVLFDIGHPAHVHVFKNVIARLESEGHTVLATASDKEMAVALLRHYGVPHVVLGKPGTGMAEKAGRLALSTLSLLRVARSFAPDVLVGVSPVRAAPVAWALHRPCVGLDDTEHATLERRLYMPFVSTVLTPDCYGLNLGTKQVRYNGYHELAYLHPRYFTPDPAVLASEGLTEDTPFAVVRFVSWQAAHDMGQGGFSREGRLRLVRELSRHGRVLVSAEKGIDPELADYAFHAHPHLIHHFLYYASVCVTEGATTASECAILGTPVFYLNSLRLGYLDDQQERYGVVLNYHNTQHEGEATDRAGTIIRQNCSWRQEWRAKATRLVGEHQDVTDLLCHEVVGQKGKSRE